MQNKTRHFLINIPLTKHRLNVFQEDEN